MSLFGKPRGKHAPGSKKKAQDAPQAEAADESAAGGQPDALEDPEDDKREDDSETAPDSEDASDGEGGDEVPGEPDGAADDDDGEVELPNDQDADDPGGFVAAGFEIPSKKRRRGLKAFGITVGVLAAVALVAYIVGAVVFMGRFLPNTHVGGHDVSLKSDAEVAALLEGIVDDYQLDVIGGGFAYRTTGNGIGLAVDSAGIIQAMHEDEGAWRWPLLLIEPDHDETGHLRVSFKPSVYEEDVQSAIATFNESATPPVNATIAYDDKNDEFIVKPEEPGTQLDAQAVLDAMSAAIDALDSKVSLSDEHLIQPTVLSTDEKLIEAAELATGMVSAELSLSMGGQPAGEITGEALSEFITIDENFEVVFKDDEMNAWVDSLAAGFNTVGTERAYTRADGKQVSVPAGGSYGWEIDTEALKSSVLEGIKSGAAAQIEVPCTATAAVYNGVGQRDWGNRYLDVDITEQHVRFYGEDGSIIWEDDFISGAPDGTHDTVPGTWYVNNKESPSKLIGYENGKKIYETSVTYWMPFEGNSIGFHDAPWQPGFGGSMYANGYGSHGCVNLSSGSARSLYDIIQVGDVVVVHF